MQFIGRKKELERLAGLSKTKANLVVIKGRRRIGKSRLVAEFAKGKTFIMLSGIPPEAGTTEQMQRDVFARQLSETLETPYLTADDWSSLFNLLHRSIGGGNCVILFDEISWMGSCDPTFLGKLKNAWDMHFSKIDGLILILCGSVSTWIEENIVKSTGFFGRISLYLKVDELSIAESNLFLDSQGFRGSAHERFKILASIGGVPWYLEQVDGKLTADDNIKNMFFKSSSILFNEFNLIFHDLFGSKGEIYKKIIERLSVGTADLNEICEYLNYTKSGAMSKYLDNLIEASFITRDFTWLLKNGEISRLSHFRLSDNYLRFYIKYVLPNEQKILLENFDEISMSSLSEWNTIMGLQFENLVLKNRRKIKDVLGIKPADIVTENPFFQRKTSTMSGCQIDYLIQTRFKTLFVCEVKFSTREIKTDVIDDMKEKLARLSVPRGFALCPVLIHVNGVSDALMDTRYFTEIIDFEQLLEAKSD